MTTQISTRGSIGQPIGRDDVERIGSRIRSLITRLRRPRVDDGALDEWRLRPAAAPRTDLQVEMARAMWRSTPR